MIGLTIAALLAQVTNPPPTPRPVPAGPTAEQIVRMMAGEDAAAPDLLSAEELAGLPRCAMPLGSLEILARTGSSPAPQTEETRLLEAMAAASGCFRLLSDGSVKSPKPREAGFTLGHRHAKHSAVPRPRLPDPLQRSFRLQPSLDRPLAHVDAGLLGVLFNGSNRTDLLQLSLIEVGFPQTIAAARGKVPAQRGLASANLGSNGYSGPLDAVTRAAYAKTYSDLIDQARRAIAVPPPSAPTRR